MTDQEPEGTEQESPEVAELKRQLAEAQQQAQANRDEAQRAFADRDELKKTLREQTVRQLQSDFPDLTADDLKGMPLDRVQALLSKVKPGTPDAKPEEKPAVTPEEQKAIQAHVDASGGAPLSTSDDTLTATQARDKWKNGEWTEAKYDAWMRRKYST